jgi:hypothetical protein
MELDGEIVHARNHLAHGWVAAKVLGQPPDAALRIERDRARDIEHAGRLAQPVGPDAVHTASAGGRLNAALAPVAGSGSDFIAVVKRLASIFKGSMPGWKRAQLEACN